MAGDPSKSIDEFFGDVLADMVKSTGKAVKQAGKAMKKGTAYNFKTGLRGTCSGELTEDVNNSSGLAVKLTPGPITAAKIGGEIAGGFDRSRGIEAIAAGGIEWYAEVTVVNAIANGDADDDEDTP